MKKITVKTVRVVCVSKLMPSPQISIKNGSAFYVRFYQFVNIEVITSLNEQVSCLWLFCSIIIIFIVVRVIKLHTL